jgi:hypothetical protein
MGFNYFPTRPQALSLFILVVLVNIAESNLILHAPQQLLQTKMFPKVINKMQKSPLRQSDLATPDY